jgi:hypothetical protein
LLLLGCPEISASDPVGQWNAIAGTAIRFSNTPPPVATRNLAILHVAMFDAVNGLEGTGRRYASYLDHGEPPVDASAEAAVAAAANQVLRQLWPQFTVTLDEAYLAQIRVIPNSPARAAGIAWGRQVANGMLNHRAFDGASFGVDYEGASGPGRWEPTPPLFVSALLPQWAGVLPFAMEHPGRFRPGGPPALSTLDWARQCNEVKELGRADSAIRTLDQTEIAWFWADNPGSETPPGHWNAVARELVVQHPRSLLESARLFAVLNVALADTAIAVWEAKYVYAWWRPVTAIRMADTDGNPETSADPTWTSLVSTPPFPEHVSGHSGFSAAAAEVLASFHGGDGFEFTLQSDGLFGVQRTYSRFSDAAEEAGMSRIYGGIHFMSANLEGQACGRAVGRHVLAEMLVPVDLAQLRIETVGNGCRLTWPRGYVLEATAAMAGEWMEVPVDSPCVVEVENGNRFFRLRLR